MKKATILLMLAFISLQLGSCSTGEINSQSSRIFNRETIQHTNTLESVISTEATGGKKLNNEQPDKPDTFKKAVLSNDVLFYRLDDNYIINAYGKETKIPVYENSLNEIREYQIFLSDDLSKLYYNTEFPDTEGRLYVYNIDNKKRYDLLDSLGIKIQGYISVFSYRNNKIIAVIGKSIKSKDGLDTEKKVTHLLLEIDLNSHFYRLIDLPFVPAGVDIYRGLGFLGENYILCQSGYSTDKKHNQSLVIVDRQGKLVEELPLYEEAQIYNVLVSPDNKSFTYQLGQTPDSLYLYDMNSRQKQVLFDAAKYYSETGNYAYCTYSMWSKHDNFLYYILMKDVKADNNGNFTRINSLYRYNIKNRCLEE